MPLSSGVRDGIATAIFAGTTHVAVLDTAAAEIAGGTYARQAATFATTANVADNDAEEVWTIPGGNEAGWYAGYDAGAAGNQTWRWPIQGNTLTEAQRLPYEAVAEADDEILYARAHPFTTGDRVVLFNKAGAAMPTGLTEAVFYWVVGANATGFQVSLTEGGAAVNVTADGRCWAVRAIPETFGDDGTLTLPAGGLDGLGTVL